MTEIDESDNRTDRAEADKEYGFSIYQEDLPSMNRIRVVEVEVMTFKPVEAPTCQYTLEIGEIKIVRSSQVQDGVERLVIMAGKLRGNTRVDSRIVERLCECIRRTTRGLARDSGAILQ